MKLNVYKVSVQDGDGITSQKYSFYSHENFGNGARRVCLEKVGILEIPDDYIGELHGEKGFFPRIKGEKWFRSTPPPSGISADDIFSFPYHMIESCNFIKDPSLNGVDLV